MNQRITIRAEDGTQIDILVPAGSLDLPTARGEELMRQVENPEHWKLPTRPYVTKSREDAEALAYTLDWYLGGHEMGRTSDWQYVVTSRGYYYYAGAYAPT